MSAAMTFWMTVHTGVPQWAICETKSLQMLQCQWSILSLSSRFQTGPWECKCCCQPRDENIMLSLSHKLLASSSHPAIEAPVVFMVAWQPHTIDMVMVGYILTHTHSQNRNVYRPQAFSEPQHKDHHLDSCLPLHRKLQTLIICYLFVCVLCVHLWERQEMNF